MNIKGHLADDCCLRITFCLPRENRDFNCRDVDYYDLISFRTKKKKGHFTMCAKNLIHRENPVYVKIRAFFVPTPEFSQPINSQ